MKGCQDQLARLFVASSWHSLWRKTRRQSHWNSTLLRIWCRRRKALWKGKLGAHCQATSLTQPTCMGKVRRKYCQCSLRWTRQKKKEKEKSFQGIKCFKARSERRQPNLSALGFAKFRWLQRWAALQLLPHLMWATPERVRPSHTANGFVRVPIAEGSTDACEIRVGLDNGSWMSCDINIPPRSFNTPEQLAENRSLLIYVLHCQDGAFDAQVGEDIVTLATGSSMVIRPGEEYCLRNGSDQEVAQLKMVLINSSRS